MATVLHSTNNLMHIVHAVFLQKLQLTTQVLQEGYVMIQQCFNLAPDSREYDCVCLLMVIYMEVYKL